MELVKQLIPILMTLSLSLMVVGAGMGSSRGEFAYVLQRPHLLARAVIAVNIIPILGAVAIIALFPSIPPAAKAGIIFMAISPVPPLVPGKALKLGGRVEYVYGLQVAMALLAIVTVPLLGTLTAAFYHSSARFPMAVVASNIAIGLIAPLVLGVALRTLWPKFAQGYSAWVLTTANILLIIAFVPILGGAWRQMVQLIGDGTVVAMIAVILVAVLGGHVLGERSPSDRTTLVFAAAMRHPGIALALVGANHFDKSISAAVLLFLLVGVLTLIPYQILARRDERRRALRPDHTAEADV